MSDSRHQLNDGGMQSSTNEGFPLGNEQLNDIQAAKLIYDNFPRIDTNANGFLSDTELLNQLSKSAFGTKEYLSSYSFRKNLGAVEGLSNDEYGFENDGISRKDLSKYLSLSKTEQVRRSVQDSVSASPFELPNLTFYNSPIVGAAASIRNATYKDSLVDTGTDEDTINTTLKDLSQAQRARLVDFYPKQYGVNLTTELESEMSGSQLDHTLNLLFREDNRANDAGFIHELLVENQEWLGRSRQAIAKGVRDKLSSMSSEQIESAKSDYGHLYNVGLGTAIVKQGRFDKHTNAAIEIYLKGADKRTSDDVLKLASIAIQAKSLEMFEEAMRGSSDEARKEFFDHGGEEKLKEAFGGKWRNLLQYLTIGLVPLAPLSLMPQGNVSNAELNKAKDVAENGKLSASTLVDASTTWFGDNEKAIEQTIGQMSDEDRNRYLRGRDLLDNKSTDFKPSADEQKAIRFYDGLHKALQTGGNATEMLMWEDQIAHKGGTLVTQLGRHNHFFQDSAMDDVLKTIENVNKDDWERLAKDEKYHTQVVDVLKTFLSTSELKRATDLIDRVKGFDNFAEKQDNGRRSIVDSINDNRHRGFLWLNTKEDNIWSAIENMTKEEQKQYRESESFRRSVDDSVKASLGSGAEQEVAFDMLEQIKKGDSPKRSIVDQIIIEGNHWFPDRGKVLREVEKEFRNRPETLNRIRSPRSQEDLHFSQRFLANLRNVMGPLEFASSSSQLLSEGSFPLAAHIEANSSIFGVDERGVLKGMAGSNNLGQRRDLSDRPEVKQYVNSAFNDSEAQLGQVVMRQGAFRPEDHLRAFALGVGASAEETMSMLSSMNPQEREHMVRAYSVK